MDDTTITNAFDQAATEDSIANRDFDPTFPAHDTQPARLLAVTLLGKVVDPLQGWITLGIYRLSDAKFRLDKEMGWPMTSSRLKVSNKFGELCHVALYMLPQWAIDAAGAKGRAFAELEMRLMAERKAA